MKLALLGGTPLRKSPFTQWPIFGVSDEQRLLRALRSGKWGKLNGSEVATMLIVFMLLVGLADQASAWLRRTIA